MPPRLDILQKRWSTFDLPILPFLAPRVFKPWPFDTRRTYFEGQEVKKRAENFGNLSIARSTHRRYRKLSRKKSQVNLQVDGLSREESVSRGEALHGNQGREEENPEGHRGRLQEPEDGNFLHKYEEIWSMPVKQKPVRKPSKSRKPADNVRPKVLRYVQGRSHIIPGIKRSRFGPVWERARGNWLARRKDGQALARKHLKLRIMASVDRLGIPRVRPRHISLPLRMRYKFPWSYGQWHRSFALLNLCHERFMEGKQISKEVIFHARRPTTKLPEEVKKVLSNNAPLASSAFRLTWHNLDKRTRSTIWPEVMLQAMETQPKLAFDILEVTYCQPYPPSFAVSNCLEYIIAHIFRRPFESAKERSRFVKRVRVLLYLGSQKRVYLPQHSIRHLMSNMNANDIMHLYVTLKQIQHPLHENTLLNFASRLAKAGSPAVVLALEVMQKMKDLGYLLNTPKALSVFSSMLYRRDRDQNARQLDSTVLEFMMDSGVSPNIITYNILLQNAMRDGEFETGWNIYEMMIETGIEPDAFTYSSLLNDSKRRMDTEAIKRVVGLVKAKDIRDSHIVTDVLHAIFLLQNDRMVKDSQNSEHNESRHKPAFDRMLQVYCEYFNIQPLQALIPSFTSRYSGLVAMLISSDSPEQQHYLYQPPSVPTIVVMATAYLAGLRDSASVTTFYDNFNKLLAVGDPVAKEVAKTTHIWSRIIINLSRFSDGLAECPGVVGNMLSNSRSVPVALEDADENDPRVDPLHPEHHTYLATSEKLGQSVAAAESTSTSIGTPQLSTGAWSHNSSAAPDVVIWSILLKIFMNHGQPRAAEKVLEMMIERGVKPNKTTWNTLIVGYSKMQATLETVDALRRMEEAGFGPDDVTMKALSKLQDRSTMMAAMERNDRSRAQRKEQEQLENAIQDVDGDKEGGFYSDELIKQWDQEQQPESVMEGRN